MARYIRLGAVLFDEKLRNQVSGHWLGGFISWFFFFFFSFVGHKNTFTTEVYFLSSKTVWCETFVPDGVCRLTAVRVWGWMRNGNLWKPVWGWWWRGWLRNDISRKPVMWWLGGWRNDILLEMGGGVGRKLTVSGSHVGLHETWQPLET